MKFLNILSGLLAVFALSSCSTFTTKWIVPTYTNVQKISTLKQGMSLAEVNKGLGIKPFDVYHLTEDGAMLLVYNYRVQERNMTYTHSDQLKDESSQTGGTLWYTNPYQVYVIFRDGKLSSYITDNGYEYGEYLMVLDNTLRIVSKDHLSKFDLVITEEVKSPSIKQFNVEMDGGTSRIAHVIPITRPDPKKKRSEQTLIQQTKDPKAQLKAAGIGCASVAAAAGILLAILGIAGYF